MTSEKAMDEAFDAYMDTVEGAHHTEALLSTDLGEEILGIHSVNQTADMEEKAAPSQRILEAYTGNGSELMDAEIYMPSDYYSEGNGTVQPAHTSGPTFNANITLSQSHHSQKSEISIGTADPTRRKRSVD
jgi:hypothetical protein